MDIMTVAGWIAAVAIMAFGIMYDSGTGDFLVTNISRFYDLPSIAVVLGGVVASLMVSFPLRYFTRVPKHLKIVLFPTKYNPQEYIDQIVDLATAARMNGLLSLEEKLNNTQDAFLRNSMMLVVDAVEPEKVKKLLETELEYLDDRHAQDRAFYDRASAFAPAFGMIGTLMGLINLMDTLDNPDAIPPAMALALVTTFYGSILSNLVFTPISNKLKVRHDEEYLCKLLVAEGVQAIQAGDNPRFIEEKLIRLIPAFLAERRRGSGENGGGRQRRGGRKEK